MQTDAANAAAIFLCRYDGNSFILDLTPSLAFFWSANVGLINLNLAREAIAAGADKPGERKAALTMLAD